MAVDNFPLIPQSRNALTARDVVQYVTQIAKANDDYLDAETVALAATVAAQPVITVSGTVPSVGKIGDLWLDTSDNNAFRVCFATYLIGASSKEDNWYSVRDVTTLAAATTADSTANTPHVTRGAAFPSAYTQHWIFVVSGTGAVYVCTATYTAATAEVDRPSKFQALLDVATAAALTSVQSSVDDMADDGKITPSEKNILYREWGQIQANKTAMTTYATALALTLHADYLAAVTAYNNLNTYLNTTIAVFGNLTTTTTLADASSTRTAWDTMWKTWYSTSDTFSNTASTVLRTDIDASQSDETITEAEARDYEIRWNYEVDNRTNQEAVIDALEAGGFAVKAANTIWLEYASAYSVLNTYLNTTLNLFANATWPFVLSSVGSSAAAWKAAWDAYSIKERAMSVLGNTTLSASIDEFANDGKIDAQEKRGVIQAWAIIYGTTGANGEYQLLVDRATVLIAAGNTSLSAALAALENAFALLDAYLISLGATLFDVTAADLTVVNATWDAKWKAYYVAHAELDRACAAIADVGVGLVSGLVDDEVITAGKEKQNLIDVLANITTEKTYLLVKAAIAPSADTTAFAAAYAALQTYLFGVFTNEAGFNNVATSAAGISRSVWQTKFNGYYAAREALENDILLQITTDLTRDSAAIPNMATDGEITSAEKYVAQQYWTVIYGTADNGEHDALVTQATDLGVTQGFIDDFEDAFTLLWNFLTDDTHGAPISSSDPTDLFTAMGSSKTLTSAQQAEWQTVWSDYYANRDVVQGRIVTALQTNLDAKLSKSGGVMSGALDMDGNNILDVANINLSGNLTLSGTPAGAAMAMRRDQIEVYAVAVAGDTMTGALNVDYTTPRVNIKDNGGADIGRLVFYSGAGIAGSIGRGPNVGYLEVVATHATIGLSMASKKIESLTAGTTTGQAVEYDQMNTALALKPVINHTHTGAGSEGPKLTQANSHESPDTDTGTGSLHHTIGAGANQAAAGNHTHSAYDSIGSAGTANTAGNPATSLVATLSVTGIGNTTHNAALSGSGVATGQALVVFSAHRALGSSTWKVAMGEVGALDQFTAGDNAVTLNGETITIANASNDSVTVTWSGANVNRGHCVSGGAWK